jgi:hypothetical protein
MKYFAVVTKEEFVESKEAFALLQSKAPIKQVLEEIVQKLDDVDLINMIKRISD